MVESPTGKRFPGAAAGKVQVRLPAGVQLSVAVGAVQVATWSQVVRPGPVLTVISAGQLAITGGMVSAVVPIVTVVCAVQPFPSVAVIS